MYSSGWEVSAGLCGSSASRMPRACCSPLRSTLMHSAAMMSPDLLWKYTDEQRSSLPSPVNPR
jgi:hypothetical protein